MTAQIIDGKAYAAGLRTRIAQAVDSLEIQPCLAVVLVGDDPASRVYVKNKIKFTKEAGMRSVEHRLPKTATQNDIENIVRTLNKDETVDGILVQLPLPKGLDSNAVIAEIDPAKDVDGLTDISAGRLTLGQQGLRPCTPTGCVMLAKDHLGDLSGKHCVVIGRSILVGKPAALLFLEQNCTVTIAHSRTKNIEDICRQADIIIAAVGRPNMIEKEWIQQGACVIDVGINRVANPERPGKTKLVGDVDYEGALSIAGGVTPVPGGVGPMTIACLLRNTVIAACYRRGHTLPDILDF